MGRSASTQPLVSALEFFGANAADIARWTAAEPQGHRLPEHRKAAIAVFIAIQSQWRWCQGQIVGLDYAGLLAYVRLQQITLSQEDFFYIQRLESRYLELSLQSAKDG